MTASVAGARPVLRGFVSRAGSTEASTAFARRFLPLPVDCIGAPYDAQTAVAIVDRLAALRKVHHLHICPAVFTLGDAARICGETARALLEQSASSSFEVLVRSATPLHNLSRIHGASHIRDLVPEDDGAGAGAHSQQQQQQNRHRIYHRGRWHIAGQGPVGGDAAGASQSHQLLWRRHSRQHMQEQQADGGDAGQHHGSKRPHHYWFSHPSVVPELDALLRQHPEYGGARLWAAPGQLPRMVAASERVQCPFVVPRTLVSGADVLAAAPSRATLQQTYQFRQFHFWARTGLRIMTAHRDAMEKQQQQQQQPSTTTTVAAAPVSPPPTAIDASAPLSSSLQARQEAIASQQRQLTDEVVAKLAARREREDFRRMTMGTEFFAWFSKIDCKLFGLVPRPGEEEPAMRFVETRVVAVVPIDAAYLSCESMGQLSALIPQPPARTNNAVRLLRSDLKWSLIPAERVEVPQHSAQDAEAAMSLPLCDSALLQTLGISHGNFSICITVRILQNAWNVMQLMPKDGFDHQRCRSSSHAAGGGDAAAAADAPPPWYAVAKAHASAAAQ